LRRLIRLRLRTCAGCCYRRRFPRSPCRLRAPFHLTRALHEAYRRELNAARSPSSLAWIHERSCTVEDRRGSTLFNEATHNCTLRTSTCLQLFYPDPRAVMGDARKIARRRRQRCCTSSTSSVHSSTAVNGFRSPLLQLSTRACYSTVSVKRLALPAPARKPL